ncbi:unnamed protein product, partial [Vitis vinifera]|uniref:Uncharacterized protein n=1 Tax=Vitis vinifera TaxID=29760 RepID=D7TD81_VITVI
MHIRHVGTKLATFAKTSAIDLSKKQVVTDNINRDKDVVVQKLRNTTVEDESCG